jgi:trehalose 6-phosphate phosphatase
MRTLGTRLGVVPGALYRHVRSKEQLQDLVLDGVLAEVDCDVNHALPWTEQIKILAHRLRKVLEDHPGIAGLLKTRDPLGPHSLALAEAVLLPLHNAGFPHREAGHAFFLILDYTIGFEVSNPRTSINEQRVQDTATRKRLHEFFRSLPGDRFPTLIALGEHVWLDNRDERFTAGVNALVNGLERADAGRDRTCADTPTTVTTQALTVRELPDALRDGGQFAERLAGRRPAVFLDYDGVLTPIVDRPEDAVMSEGMRDAVQALAQRCSVCVVSGRDRPVVQQMMGVGNLVVAGSHGFDIWSPQEGTIAHAAATGFEDLISEVTDRLRVEVESIPGAVVEPKRASAAVHYRLADREHRAKVGAVVDELLEEYSGRLKVTPGKMVYELQPKIDWHKGKAVLHLLQTLDLDADDVAPLYLGDDITDEDAFRALAGRGIGIIVGHPDDPEVANRPTVADFVLESTVEVEQFLNTLAR